MTAVHALAVALQGVAFLLLLEPARELPAAALIPVGFALAGAGLGWLWHRWAAIPHALDMAFGMLTLGNLGMLLGWWADAGFAPLTECGCCCAADRTATPGMWLGMLLFANAAMLWLCRWPPRRSGHRAAMFTGGNVGMAAGMAAGGWCAARLPCEGVTAEVAVGYAGMSLGMVAGMLSGTWLAEGLIAAGAATPVLLKHLRAPRRTS